MAPHNFITGGNTYVNVDRIVQFATLDSPNARLDETYGNHFVGGKDVGDGERNVQESVQE